MFDDILDGYVSNKLLLLLGKFFIEPNINKFILYHAQEFTFISTLQNRTGVRIKTARPLGTVNFWRIGSKLDHNSS